MSDQLDHRELAHRIEAAIGEAPPAPGLDGLLTAGRRARTRRRWAQGSAALALTLVVGGGAFTAAESLDGTTVTDPSVAAGPSASSEDRTPSPDELATLGPDGLELAAGVSQVERVENPAEVTPPEQSIGVVLERHGVRYWMLLGDSPEGSSGVVEEAGWSYSTFDLWLAEAVAV